MRRELADRLEPVFIDLHSADWIDETTYRFVDGARRFENWECFYAGKLGLAEAVRYARFIGLKRIESRVRALGAELRQRLAAIDGIEVADVGSDKCAIVTFRSKVMAAEDIRMALRLEKINVSVSSSQSQRLDLPARGIDTLVRASPHYYNTVEDIERLCSAVSAITSGRHG
jgi:selenocysteine lyase/cysteine desulfurase